MMTLTMLIMIVMMMVMIASLTMLTSRSSTQSKTEASFQTVMSGSKKPRSKAAVSEKMSMRDR